MFNARPYQVDCINGNSKHPGILKAWQQSKHTLSVLPTGSGKTIIFAMLAERIVADGGRVLVLAHRAELLQQAADKIHMVTGLSCAVEKAEASSVGCMEMITVGSVQSLINPERRDGIHAPTHIIVDEAHHAVSESYQNVLARWPDAYVLGVTASPDRSDLKELGSYFDTLAFEYTLPEAITQGYLAKIRALTLPLKIDMSKCEVQNGDYTTASVARALVPYLPHISADIAEQGKNRKTLVFAPLCATAQDVQRYIESAGLKCFYCSGEDRSQIAAWEKHGPGCAMVNAMLLTEGYDHPAIDTICVLRATNSRPLYAQMCGRGTRLFPGKDHLLILDFLWQSEKHSLCRPANLICEDDDLALAMEDQFEKEPGGEGVELDAAALDRARQELIEKREAALAKKLAEMRHKKRQLVDPLQYAMSIGDPSLAAYTPALGAERAAPTSMQIDALAKAGIFPEEINSSGQAAAILNKIQERSTAGMAMPRQVRCLERYGIKNAGQMTHTSAQKIIARIAANGWRLPTDLRRMT